MKIIIKITIIIYLSLVAIGCDHSLKNQIKEYKGEGVIKYLSAPGIFGASGCSITLPEFTLNTNHQITYDLTSIPQGDGYIVFIVIPNEDTYEKIKENNFSYIVRSDDKILVENSSVLKSLVKTYTGHEPVRRLYFHPNESGNFDFSIPTYKTATSILIQYTNSNLKEPLNGHLLISRGGFK